MTCARIRECKNRRKSNSGTPQISSTSPFGSFIAKRCDWWKHFFPHWKMDAVSSGWHKLHVFLLNPGEYVFLFSSSLRLLPSLSTMSLISVSVSFLVSILFWRLWGGERLVLSLALSQALSVFWVDPYPFLLFIFSLCLCTGPVGYSLWGLMRASQVNRCCAHFFFFNIITTILTPIFHFFSLSYIPLSCIFLFSFPWPASACWNVAIQEKASV